MNTNLYEDLKDVLKPMSDEDRRIMAKDDFTDEEKVIKQLITQGAYQNDDGSWSCDRSVHISGMNLTAIPVKFKRVEGNFVCSDNQLTTLKRAPEYVGSYFYCMHNRLTTLKGIGGVKGDIFCDRNPVSPKNY